MLTFGALCRSTCKSWSSSTYCIVYELFMWGLYSIPWRPQTMTMTAAAMKTWSKINIKCTVKLIYHRWIKFHQFGRHAWLWPSWSWFVAVTVEPRCVYDNEMVEYDVVKYTSWLYWWQNHWRAKRKRHRRGDQDVRRARKSWLSTETDRSRSFRSVQTCRHKILLRSIEDHATRSSCDCSCTAVADWARHFFLRCEL